MEPISQGCSSFNFRNIFQNVSSTYSVLSQFSENPAVYTKLSCFLPWVAAQYDLEYTPVGEADPACLTGQGDITEVTAKVCRTTPSDIWADQRDQIEARCIFPFTLNGESHSTCILDELREGLQNKSKSGIHLHKKPKLPFLNHFQFFDSLRASVRSPDLCSGVRYGE